MSQPAGSFLRFPVVFGSILLGFGLAFYNRDKFMTGLEEERDRLNKEDLEAKQILLDKIESVRRARIQ
uniref:Putative secreted protein n=1 Tax=Anopheles triannulatus TaxID=58253 RepID=A0A2M4AYX1_9DIPT